MTGEEKRKPAPREAPKAGAPQPDYLTKAMSPEAAPPAAEGNEAGGENAPRDNSKECLGALDTLWDAFERIKQPAGREWPGIQAKIEEWRAAKIQADVVVVTGFHRGGTQWAAEAFAAIWREWKDLRRGEASSLGGYRYDEVIRDHLIVAPSRCVVLDAWSEYAPLRVDRIAETAADFRGRGFGMIFWMPAAPASHSRWPENIAWLELPPFGVDAAGGSAADCVDFGRIFGRDVASLAEVLTLQQQTIEQALIRISVLFGELPEGDFEELLLAVLGSQAIALKEASEGAEPTRFSDLWHRGKPFFLKNAGLVCRSDETPCRVAFRSVETRDAAAEMAWGDTQAMIRIFSAVEELTILFADESARHRRDLYRGYVLAAAVLARRAPVLFGDQWLEAISQQYVRWALDKVPEIDFASHRDILSVLEAIEKRQGQSARLWNRFVERMGFLCRHLSEHSLEIVEDFFVRLESRGLHPLLWKLVFELRGSRLDFSRWIARIFNSHHEAGRTAFRRMAGASAIHLPSAQDFHALFAAQVREEEDAPVRRFESAALAFPAHVLSQRFNLIEKCWENPELEVPGFGEMLDLPLAGAREATPRFGSIRDYWRACFCSPGFAAATRVWADDEVPPDFLVALALFQFVVLSGPSAADFPAEFVAEVQAADERRWQRMRPHWKSIGDFFRARARRLSFEETDEEPRRHFELCLEACQQLNSL